jgi:hypothetical protein
MRVLNTPTTPNHKPVLRLMALIEYHKAINCGYRKTFVSVAVFFMQSQEAKVAKVQRLEVISQIVDGGVVVAESVLSGGAVMDRNYDMTEFWSNAGRMVEAQAQYHMVDVRWAMLKEQLAERIEQLDAAMARLEATLAGTQGAQ